MKAIFKRRLLKLAEHLERGELEHRKFYFGNWNVDEKLSPLHTNGCGFAGCAVGECPQAFPQQWRWKDGQPTLRTIEHTIDPPIESAQEFFGLDEDEMNHLFIPSFAYVSGGSRFSVRNQRPWRYGGRVLGNRATKEQVAANIRAFIKTKEAKAK